VPNLIYHRRARKPNQGRRKPQLLHGTVQHPAVGPVRDLTQGRSANIGIKTEVINMNSPNLGQARPTQIGPSSSPAAIVGALAVRTWLDIDTRLRCARRSSTMPVTPQAFPRLEQIDKICLSAWSPLACDSRFAYRLGPSPGTHVSLAATTSAGQASWQNERRRSAVE
jgi:hypothetical protein